MTNLEHVDLGTPGWWFCENLRRHFLSLVKTVIKTSTEKHTLAGRDCWGNNCRVKYTASTIEVVQRNSLTVFHAICGHRTVLPLIFITGQTQDRLQIASDFRPLVLPFAIIALASYRTWSDRLKKKIFFLPEDKNAPSLDHGVGQPRLDGEQCKADGWHPLAGDGKCDQVKNLELLFNSIFSNSGGNIQRAKCNFFKSQRTIHR